MNAYVIIQYNSCQQINSLVCCSVVFITFKCPKSSIAYFISAPSWLQMKSASENHDYHDNHEKLISQNTYSQVYHIGSQTLLFCNTSPLYTLIILILQPFWTTKSFPISLQILTRWVNLTVHSSHQKAIHPISTAREKHTHSLTNIPLACFPLLLWE